MPLIERTLDPENSRQWYYALMDYGVMLKKNVGNLCKLSKHYTKQSKFEGSNRQIRGMILQALIDNRELEEAALLAKINREAKRIETILYELITEGFVTKKENNLSLTTKIELAP
jgi:A/G-specific adenine glycosylase